MIQSIKIINISITEDNSNQKYFSTIKKIETLMIQSIKNILICKSNYKYVTTNEKILTPK